MATIDPEADTPPWGTPAVTPESTAEYVVVGLTFGFGPYPAPPTLRVRPSSGESARETDVAIPETGVDYIPYGRPLVTVEGRAATWLDVLRRCRRGDGTSPKVALTFVGEPGRIAVQADFR